MKQMDSAKMDRIKNEVRAALKAGAAPVAAFDADGTLWKCDMGENFFQYKIDHKLVKFPADPWAHYEMLKKRSHPEAYLWLAQILEGKTLEQTRQWAQAAVDTFPGGAPVFVWMKELIGFLKSEGVEVYIVTASIKWSVDRLNMAKNAGRAIFVIDYTSSRANADSAVKRNRELGYVPYIGPKELNTLYLPGQNF